MRKTTQELISEYQAKGRRIKTVKRGRHGKVRVTTPTSQSNTSWDFGRVDKKTDRERFGRIVEKDWEPKQRSSFYWR